MWISRPRSIAALRDRRLRNERRHDWLGGFFGGRTTCESCKSIDVRRWHREGRLGAGQQFPMVVDVYGEPSGVINVRTEQDAPLIEGPASPQPWP